MQRFLISIEWTIEYKNDNFDKKIAFDTIIEMLDINDHSCKNWYKTLEDIYEMKTNNFDGYVHKVNHINEEYLKYEIFNQYLHKIEIECYLVENYNLKDFKAKYLDTWILMQNSNIIRAFEKNISNFNYKENDEILAFIKIINISLNQLA